MPRVSPVAVATAAPAMLQAMTTVGLPVDTVGCTDSATVMLFEPWLALPVLQRQLPLRVPPITPPKVPGTIWCLETPRVHRVWAKQRKAEVHTLGVHEVYRVPAGSVCKLFFGLPWHKTLPQTSRTRGYLRV